MSYYDDVNKVMLTGWVGKEPVVSGKGKKPFAAFSLATNKSYKQDGNQVQQTTWHDVACYGPLAESVKQHVKTGAHLHVEGELTYYTWKNKAGEEQCSTNIIIKELRFLDVRKTLNEAAPPFEAPSLSTE